MYKDYLSMHEAKYLTYGWFNKELQGSDHRFPDDLIEMILKFYYRWRDPEPFKPQPLLKFDDALDILMDGRGIFGVYDFKIKTWRPAIYMTHLPAKQSIMVRYVHDIYLNPSCYKAPKDEYVLLRFPSDCVEIDVCRYKTGDEELRNCGYLSLDKIEEWVKRYGPDFIGDQDKNRQACLHEIALDCQLEAKRFIECIDFENLKIDGEEELTVNNCSI